MSYGSNPFQPKMPFGFSLSERGLWKEQPGDNPAKFIAGPFEIIAQTRDHEGTGWGLLLRWKDDDGQVHQYTVKRATLAGDGRDVRQILMDGGLYIAPDIGSRNALVEFLASVKTPRRARQVLQLGWTPEGAFALPDRTIASAESELVIYNGPFAKGDDYSIAGTLEAWQATVATWAAGNTRLVVAICAGLAGPLLHLIGAEGGGIHFRGKSSIGKSTALLAGASIWGPPSFVKQWRATPNGLEGIAAQSNHTFLILDELAQLDPKDAASTAYLLANGGGKVRASQNGNAQPVKRWLTFFLSSGEISLAQHVQSEGRGKRQPAGQEVRILDIEADAGVGLGLFDSLVGFPNGSDLSQAIKDAAATNYGHAGPEFVRLLLGKQESIAEQVRLGIERFVKEYLPPDSSGQVVRVCQRFGMIAMAGEVATSLGILPWATGTAENAARELFASWVALRGGAGQAEDRKAREQVASFLVIHGQSRFQEIGKEDRTVVSRAGFIREIDGKREYLIPPNVWRDEVCQGLSGRAVAKELLEAGHLKPDSDNRSSVTVSVPGMGSARYYIVRESIFDSEEVQV